MSSSPYAKIARIHKRFHNATCRLITLDDGAPALSPPRYVILGDGNLDIMEPIAKLFGLDCIRELSHVRLKCPIVIRVYPGTQTTESKCRVSIRRAEDNTLKLFSESTNESNVAEIIFQAHIASSTPEAFFEKVKKCKLDHETVKEFNEQKIFTDNEVCVELYGLQLPCVEICALPGPRAEWAGGKIIETIIRSYFNKEENMAIVMHRADLSLDTSRSLGLLEKYDQANWAGLIVRHSNASDDDIQVTQASSPYWFQESALDELRLHIVIHNIRMTMSWYVFVQISKTCD
jgi:hypothetical protein